MNSITQKILEEIKSLSPFDRAELLNKIYESFDDEIDPEIEKAWVSEAERRISEYRKGVITAVPAEDVFRRIADKKI